MPDLVPNTRLADRYTIERLHKTGGMGTIYRAYDEDARRVVAVKTVSEKHAGDRTSRGRLKREAEAAALVDHPAVVRVFDVGETPDGDLFIVMEFIDGKSLRELEPTIDPAEVLRVVADLADCLDAIHAAGLVHRDVKPENVMVRDDGRVALLDFGVAKALKPALLGLSTAGTERGALVGTPLYLSPEQANDRPVEPASDRFALAVLAYEMLLGRVPWTATNPYAVIGQILSDDPVWPSVVLGTKAAGLDALIEKALAKEPRDRFATARDFAAALATAWSAPRTPNALGDSTAGVNAVARSSVPDLRKTGRRVASAAIVGGAVAAIAWRVLAARHPPPPAPIPQPAPVLADDTSVLACPAFDAPAGKGFLGAAAADLACTRARTVLGGTSARTRSPAELLGLPTEPTAGFPDDPYGDGASRPRAIAAAMASASALLDGAVVADGAGFEIDLALRASSGARLESTSATAPNLYSAVAKALDALLALHGVHGHATQDPSVSPWLISPDTDLLLLYREAFSTDDRGPCDAAQKLIGGRPIPWRHLWERCKVIIPDWEKPRPPSVLEETPEGLVRTAYSHVDEVPADAKRVLALVTRAEGITTSGYGRARLANVASELYLKLDDLGNARISAMAAIHASPVDADWTSLARAYDGDDHALASAAWNPSDLSFYLHSSRRSPVLTRIAQRHYELGHRDEWTVLHLAGLLLDGGETAKVIDLAAQYPVTNEEQGRTQRSLYALASRSEGKLEKALADQRDAVMEGKGGETEAFLDLVQLADLLERRHEIADAWLAKFPITGDRKSRDWDYEAAAIAMCLRASAAVAKTCVAELEEKAKGGDSSWSWSEGSRAFLAGAEKFLEHDDAGAVRELRRVFALRYFVELLPAEIFDRAGDRELAERADERLIASKGWKGINPALPRAASRAWKRGDRALARKLASQVVDAWIDADTEVPAVKQMKTILGR